MMSSQQPRAEWVARYLRVGGGLTIGLALFTWLAPVNVLGANLVPFGCGSPASPTGGDLAALVCTMDLDHTKTLAVTLLISAGCLLLLSELGVPRWLRHGWFVGLMGVAPISIALLLWSGASTFLIVGGVAADGTLIRCGSAVTPAVDTMSTNLCGGLVDRRLSTAIGGALAAVGLAVGAAYIGAGRKAPAELSEGSGPSIDTHKEESQG